MTAHSNTVQVAFVKPEQATPAPFVAYHANGPPAASTSHDQEFELYKPSTSGRGVPNYILVCGQDDVEYIADTTRTESAGPPPCSYAVGVYSKSAGTLRLMPVQANRILRIEPRVAKLDYGAHARDPEEQAEQEADRQSRRLQTSRLVDQFGSTRRKRTLAAREEAVLRVDQLASGEALARVATDMATRAQEEGLTRQQVLQRSAQHRNIPPHHLDATRGQDAYVLTELVPGSCWDDLHPGLLIRASEKADLADDLKAKRQIPAYVHSRLFVLLNEKDKAARKNRARALAFLSALLRLHSARNMLRVDPDKGGIEAEAKRLHMRRELLESLLDLFYNHSKDGNVDKYERESSKRDLQLGYILVTALLAEDCHMGTDAFEALRQQLLMTPSEVIQRFRELGCTCTSSPQQSAEGAPTRSYTVSLLRDNEDTQKTLAECFPRIRTGKSKR